MKKETSGSAGGRLAVVVLGLCAAACASGPVPSTHGAGAPGAPRPAFTVSGDVALSSLIALCDGHLLKMADALHLLAMTEAARGGDWSAIEAPLTELSRRNVDALNWFARPDGTYWSVQHGAEEGDLSGRDYFPRVLAGESVIGELVVSRATGKAVAIVAVPVVGETGSVEGVLGASVYLDRLSERIRDEMGLDETMIFYSFDEAPLVALNWDPALIFLEPMETQEEDTIRAFETMLAREAGEVRYAFRDQERTVLFRRSPVTRWWYAFGIVPEGRAAAHADAAPGS
jgi:hypothetical protein